MTATKIAMGLEPVRMQGSRPNSAGYTQYPIANGNTSDMFLGDPVALNTTGKVILVSTSTQFALGVFMGCFYIDNVTARPTWSKYFPATTSAFKTSRMFAFVADDPNGTFYITADASVTTGDIGLNFDVSLGTGSTVTGRSACVLKAASREATPGLLQVVDVALRPDNDFSDVNAADAFPICEVRWVDHRQMRTSAN